MNAKDKLMEVLQTQKPFSEEIQKKIGRDRAVVYAVKFMENQKIDATFQRLCVVSYKLFPESFSFTEFSELPDSRIVRNCLWHCTHKSKGWLVGSDKAKYNLTEKGRETANILVNLVNNNMDITTLPHQLQSRGVTKKELVTKANDAEINSVKDIKNSKAFELFSKNKEDIKGIDVRKSLGGDRYSSSSHIQDKLLRGINACDLANEKEVKKYLEWVKQNWQTLVGD